MIKHLIINTLKLKIFNLKLKSSIRKQTLLLLCSHYHIVSIEFWWRKKYQYQMSKVEQILKDRSVTTNFKSSYPNKFFLTIFKMRISKTITKYIFDALHIWKNLAFDKKLTMLYIISQSNGINDKNNHRHEFFCKNTSISHFNIVKVPILTAQMLARISINVLNNFCITKNKSCIIYISWIILTQTCNGYRRRPSFRVMVYYLAVFIPMKKFIFLFYYSRLGVKINWLKHYFLHPKKSFMVSWFLISMTYTQHLWKKVSITKKLVKMFSWLKIKSMKKTNFGLLTFDLFFYLSN